MQMTMTKLSGTELHGQPSPLCHGAIEGFSRCICLQTVISTQLWGPVPKGNAWLHKLPIPSRTDK